MAKFDKGKFYGRCKRCGWTNQSNCVKSVRVCKKCNRPTQVEHITKGIYQTAPAINRYPYLTVMVKPGVNIPIPILFIPYGANIQQLEGSVLVISISRPKYKGKLTARGREAVIKATSAFAKQKGISMCAVLGKKDCIYCELDGTIKQLKKISSIMISTSKY